MGLFDLFKTKQKDSNYANWNAKNKLSVLDKNNKLINHHYGNLYKIENTSSYSRIVIGPSNNHVDILLKLANKLSPPYYVLYVLLLSHFGNKIGRYQSPILNSKEELDVFFNNYKEYFESDGRHHIWIGTADNSGLLIYDQHNVIYAYGQLNLFSEILKDEKLKEGDFSFPSPHVHGYHSVNGEFEGKILKEWDWQFFPLEENDVI